MRRIVPLSCALFFISPWIAAAADDTDGRDSAQLEFFESKVRPLLIQRCYECHSSESGENEGDLLLDSRPAMLRGGHHGGVIVAGKPDESILMQAVGYEVDDMQMPPDGKLPAEEIAILRTWIESGAADARTEPTGTKAAKSSPLDRDPSSHWAYVAARNASPSDAQMQTASPHDTDVIDTFASAAATQRGITIADTADRRTLIRRLYFDLIGTPPNFDEVESFASSSREDAYARLVDRLLSRPEFGERFGRHWLDVSRYANTIGYGLAGKDRRIHGSERFRDWVIAAFADDMPYDEMILHQIAGDRTDPNNEAGNLDAMGFLTVGRRYLNDHDVVDDRIDVVTRGLLGTTVACARCHDHKFDPIPTLDYYSLYGIFHSSRLADENSPSPLAMFDKDTPGDMRVFVRGQPGNRGDIAPRQFLTSLRRDGEPRFSDGSGRYELAQRIASADNPLTARVMVNRVWAILVGRALVDTQSDFGFRTAPPAVPEVLDALAADFARDWSIQRLVRRIVNSRVYRQRTRVSPADFEADPENLLLARANRRRRDFESMRDSMLTVAGHLDAQYGGEAVDITLSTPPNRKTIYAYIDRQNLPSLFRTFDLASPDAHAPNRYYTTVPQQALYLLNHSHASFLAKRVAEVARVDAGKNANAASLATSMTRLVWQRDPTTGELDRMIAFLQQPAADVTEQVDPRSRWQYGTGRLVRDDAEPTSLADFQPFGVFQNDRWGSEEKFPADGPTKHAMLGVEQGHPGPSDAHAVVRRWHAPFAGEVRVSGMIGHQEQKGDGVDAVIFAGTHRIFHERQKSNNRPIQDFRGWVNEGETVDFVAGPGESDSFDSFFWRIKLQLRSNDGRIVEADSRADFSGPFEITATMHLGRDEQLAQVLLLSNEFAFVD